jgi:radical SAM superfamily enzyme YgiQ (UPF0313 family)
MSGLRIVDASLLELGLRFPGIARRSQALSELPPLGLLTLAATVPKGWNVSLLSDDGKNAEDDVIDSIIATLPDVVAFSALTPSVDRAGRISDRIRRRGIATIVGGLHATAAPLLCRPKFDAVAVGDGESLIPKMLDDWQNGNLQSVYRPERLFDLANAPTPKWELWGQRSVPRYTLQTMRGCPWACSFCAASRLLGPPRVKPIERITEEIARISTRQSRPWIELADDNTFANRRDHELMLAALEEAGARWFTESDWRIANRPTLLRQIAGAGCRQILIGFESSIFRYPGMAAKTADFHRMTEAAMAIQDAGIVVNACFIVGADGETNDSIDCLGEFLETAPFGEIQLTLQTPFPGSGLYDQLRSAGRLLSGDFSRYTLFDVVYQPRPMTVETLADAYRRLIARVYRPELQNRRNEITKRVQAIRRRAS